MHRKENDDDPTLQGNSSEDENTDTDEEWVEAPGLEVRWNRTEDPTMKKKIRVGMDWTWQVLVSVLWKPNKRKTKSHCIYWRLQGVENIERVKCGEIRLITA